MASGAGLALRGASRAIAEKERTKKKRPRTSWNVPGTPHRIFVSDHRAFTESNATTSFRLPGPTTYPPWANSNSSSTRKGVLSIKFATPQSPARWATGTCRARPVVSPPRPQWRTEDLLNADPLYRAFSYPGFMSLSLAF